MLTSLFMTPSFCTPVESCCTQLYLGNPGDSSAPRLIALDDQTTHLLFLHTYRSYEDPKDLVSGWAALQKAQINGKWTEVTSASIPLLGSSAVIARPVFIPSMDFSIIYYATQALRLNSYRDGKWSPMVTLFTPEELRNYGVDAITNIQAVIDSKNHLHMVWQRPVDVFENDTLVRKLGVFYSEYDGEKASDPELVVAVNTSPNKLNPTNYDPCASEFFPCLRVFLSLDSSDRLTLVWYIGPTFFTTHTPDGWTDPIQVDTTPYPHNITVQTEPPFLINAELPLLEFHIDSAGALYFFYSVMTEQKQLLLIKYHEGVFYSIVSEIPALPHPNNNLVLPMNLFSVEMDSKGIFHLAYIAPDAMDTPRLFYQTFKETFSDPVCISNVGGKEVALSIDAKDQPHIVWRQIVEHDELFYTHQTPTGWITPVQVTNGTAIDQQFGWSSPTSTTTSISTPTPSTTTVPELHGGLLGLLLLPVIQLMQKKKKSLSKKP